MRGHMPCPGKPSDRGAPARASLPHGSSGMGEFFDLARDARSGSADPVSNQPARLGDADAVR
jgi:hypothetical protein